MTTKIISKATKTRNHTPYHSSPVSTALVTLTAAMRRGTSSGSSPFVLRLTSKGNPDGTFGHHGQAALGSVAGYLFDIAVDAHDRVVGVGNSGSDGLVFRLHA